jgi:hypothetical protein
VLVTCYQNQAPQQLDSQTTMLILVPHQKRDFGGVFSVKLAQSPNGEDFVLSRVRRGAIGNERDFAVIVEKTDSPQAVVSTRWLSFDN